MEKTWMPGPYYRARMYGVKDWFHRDGNKLRLLEFGCGETKFSYNMAKKGYHVTCVDIEENSRKIQMKRVDDMLNFEVVSSLDNLTSNCYDYICSFEVLEHIENDVYYMKYFNELLKKNGSLIITVPAMMKKWSHFDELCGHIRRYEKNEIIDKLKLCNFEINEVRNYGFPLINITRMIDNFIRKNDKLIPNKESRSKLSGSGKFRKLVIPMYLAGLFGYPIISVQRLFYDCSLGIGWCIRATSK